ncbi:hypothetical protein [Billgrantia antri]|uniref:Lysozyme inhibitor LprI N-terminal domain-containing protein n=1 Tax=Billgrantia antri TaxID=2846777 RepID=A0ABS6ZTB4_9GAMM|nr:hypothetical protein [Halomonas antri]MBW6393327.1 hypothetical protein [Halomonas antri]
MPRLRTTATGMLCQTALACLLLSLATTSLANDYPTEARVDYVLGCMASNGNDYLTMQKCACSIDVIAEHLSYDTYEQVETVLGMQDQRGELGVLFRTERGMQDQVDALRQAQADANLRCF